MWNECFHNPIPDVVKKRTSSMIIQLFLQPTATHISDLGQISTKNVRTI